MTVRYTEEQLNAFDQETLVHLFLNQQEQLLDIDRKMQLLLEQVAVLNQHRIGRSSEKLAVDEQIAFMEVNGTIVFFNEAEAVASLTEDTEPEAPKARPKKSKGQREEKTNLFTGTSSEYGYVR
ncbi:MAG: hypothetical protein HFF83_14015 [Oscillibacter sp.]|jgi:hypothetical protein|nr:hypothetical protein [Oscillibacter sp.]